MNCAVACGIPVRRGSPDPAAHPTKGLLACAHGKSKIRPRQVRRSAQQGRSRQRGCRRRRRRHVFFIRRLRRQCPRRRLIRLRRQFRRHAWRNLCRRRLRNLIGPLRLRRLAAALALAALSVRVGSAARLARLGVHAACQPGNQTRQQDELCPLQRHGRPPFCRIRWTRTHPSSSAVRSCRLERICGL